ncbi:Pr6Pr family membrane protein [Zophobihabitans entericus]|uniref:Pr6Pr family membrane protein n=1 Tax=Zophobihabitans entericus TaxID=1635327 RepID=A0A6G9IB47_9GAMM|nr:Pr6Pr family membrane protein [Zophobihabitans entericus]QIQ21057.1 Pr6Pr family membrane protein [Zophobihabitans entericus]
MINRSLNILIILLVLITVGTETYTYWLMKIRPWQPDSPVGRIIFYYSFFTVLSNICLAISSAFLVINPKANSQLFRIIRLDGLVGVLITAIVYNAVLRGIHKPPTPILQMANESLHLIVPALGLLSWLIYGPYPRIDRKTVVLACIPLMIYGGYIFIRGHITGQYPYPFINVIRIGYEKAIINAGMLLGLFIVLAFILWLIERVRIKYI